MITTFATVASAEPALLDRLLAWAHVDEPGELALILFGFGAQTLFMLRWVLQWIASERKRFSHVPEAFWWISLAGASTLLVYYYLRGEPVGLASQLFGWIVYGRNLMLIRRHRTVVPA